MGDNNQDNCYCQDIYFCKTCVSVLSNKELNNVNSKILGNRTYYHKQSMAQFLINEFGTNKIPSSRAAKRGLKKTHRKKYRTQLLNQAFDEHRLEIKNYGDCYSFIHYGTPSLHEVVSNELTKLKNYQVRRQQLTYKLKGIGISYSEEYIDCSDYVFSRSIKTLDEVVRAIELDHFLTENTNYQELLPIHGKLKAQELAFREYYRDHSDDNDDNSSTGSNGSHNSLRIRFD